MTSFAQRITEKLRHGDTAKSVAQSLFTHYSDLHDHVCGCEHQAGAHPCADSQYLFDAQQRLGLER